MNESNPKDQIKIAKLLKDYNNIDLDKNKIDVGLLNPPFKMAKDDIEEFDFIFSNISAVKKGGAVIALVPVSVVTDTTGVNFENKKKLLKHHTLEAVVSLPEELFANSKTSVVTVGIVITAHIPHPKLKETWFGYWRNDGFVKTKVYGRSDVNQLWNGENGLEQQWLSAYLNRKECSQLSIKKAVTADDEWLAEAFLQTDYTVLTQADFEKVIRQYKAFKLENDL